MYEVNYAYEIIDKLAYIHKVIITFNDRIVDDVTVNIPDNLDGFPVYSIGRNACGGSKIFEVSMPNSVEIIEDGAFYRTSLQKIRLSENLKFIGKYAFSFTSIKELIIPKDVKYIGEHALEGVKNVYNLSDCDILLSYFGNITNQNVINIFNANYNSRLNLDLDFYGKNSLEQSILNTRIHFYSVNEDVAPIFNAHNIYCEHLHSEKRINKSLNYNLFSLAENANYSNVLYYKDTNQLFIQEEIMFDVIKKEIKFEHYNLYHLYLEQKKPTIEVKENVERKVVKVNKNSINKETVLESFKGIVENIKEMIRTK